MLKNFTLLFIVISNSIMFAQSTELISDFLNSPSNLSGLSNGGGFFVPYKYQDEVVSGSYFLDSIWNKGKLLSDKNEVFTIQARYRIYDDEMQILLNNRIQSLDRTKMRAVSIGEQLFIPIAYINKKGEVLNSFFELLIDGDTKLVKRRFAVITEEYYNPSLGVGKKGSKFQILEELYFWRKGKPAQLLKKNKKALLAALSDREKDVRNFMNKNKILPRKTKDLMSVFEYYNSLNKPLNKS